MYAVSEKSIVIPGLRLREFLLFVIATPGQVSKGINSKIGVSLVA